MHFEIIAEDQSAKKALDILVSKIVGEKDTFTVHCYKGIGHIPKDIKETKNASKRILLDNLPKLLRGIGKTHASYSNYPASVFVVCDLDDKCQKEFREQLFCILSACQPRPETRFCLAIEESEAWLLGDIQAIKTVYPRAKDSILNSYINDSICGTWELLANAVYAGGATALSAKGWQATGTQKSKWAEEISPHVRIDVNRSPSFNYFVRKLQELSTS